MLQTIGTMDSYYFFINLGSVLGSILVLILFYQKNHSFQ